MTGYAALIRDLPVAGFGFMLVLCRVGTAMLTGPGLGEADIPPAVRAGLATIVAALAYSALAAPLPAIPANSPDLAAMLAIEIVTGTWLGFMARMLTMALAMSGALISYMIGLSSVLQIDPSVGGQVTALQRMFSLACIALLFETGLYILPVQAVLGTYDIIPPGGTLDAAGTANLVTRAVSEGFGLAVRLAAPSVVAALVWQAAMGFVSRLVPNIQVAVVSAPAQILGGLALTAGAAGLMFEAWSDSVRHGLSSLPGL